MTSIKISGVYPPTDNQKNAKIMGVVNFSIVDDAGTDLVYLNGCMIRESKDGGMFISMPSYKVGEKYRNHFRIFPGSKDEEASKSQRARMDALTKECLRILNDGGTPRRDNNVKDTDTTTQPQTPVATTSNAPAKDHW